MNDVRDKVVVITGAARGIGCDVAKKLSAQGAKLALLGLEPELLAKVSEQLPNASHYWELDVTDAARFAEVAKEVIDHFGRVDIVVANAGIGAGAPVMYSDPASFNKIIEVNLIGSVNTARAFAAALEKTHGYYLQIASLAAILSSPWMAAYCASKAGVDMFAQVFRAEMGKKIDVGVAYLSWAHTDMVSTADEDSATREMRHGLPWPLNKTYPLDYVTGIIVNGILHRKRYIYVQKWIGFLSRNRGFVDNPLTRYIISRQGDLNTKWLSTNTPEYTPVS